MTILYDLNDEELARDLRRLRITDAPRSHVRATINIEARHELSSIMERATHFDAVAYFEAYRRNALQKHSGSVDPATRRLPQGPLREYRRRCRALAHETLSRFGLTPDDLLEFIKFECELWCTAKARSPAKLADEYARNIGSTVGLYREVTRATDEIITESVGRADSSFKPILKVIFPDWLDEQRDLAERSLKRWVSLRRCSPWMFRLLLRPPVGGSSAPSFGRKLFIEAHASISVPSTEKYSRLKSRRICAG